MARERILIVDDDRTTGKVVQMQLSKLGYSVSGIAHNAADAVESVRAHGTDLVLMDINLGSGMDGIEAANTIMREYHTPVIYVTAYSDDQTLERAKSTHPFGYINKPIRPSDLRTTITLALDRIRTEPFSAVAQLSDSDKIWKLQVVCDGDGNVADLNAAQRRKLGQLNVDNVGDLLHEEHAGYAANCRRSRQTQRLSGRRDERFLTWEYRCRDSGREIGLTITDITEHKLLVDQNIQQASLSEALNQLATGLLLVNEQLRIFYSNRSADSLLQRSRVLRINDGHLACSSAKSTTELHRLVLANTVSTLALPQAEGAPLQLLVSPLHGHNENYGHNLPTAIIYAFETATDPERIEDVIRSLYNLSPTEARLTAKLVMQPEVRTVAKDMGITYNTARTHIKRIYTKTNVNRLPALIHMIISGPAGLLLHSQD